jgi:serine phosphatase RsbU (regulator of sigma subunit)
LREIGETLESAAISPARLIFNSIGWILTFFFAIAALEIGSFTWIQIWLFGYGLFWYRLNREIMSQIPIPIELLLLSLLILSGLQYLYWGNLFADIQQNVSIDGRLGFFLGLLTAFSILLVGWLLISNQEKTAKVKQGPLITLILLGYAAHLIIFYEHYYYFYLFQLLLLLYLLNYTTWLEKLSRRDLWLYFWIALVVFIIFREPAGLHEIKLVAAPQKLTWLSLPLYFFLVVKIYFLALVIRIPIVIIYNHARLSGKLWIAGLFQSTFPQIIQFIFLVLIFYFFISSWQAQEMRRTISEFLESEHANLNSFIAKGSAIHLPDYEPGQIHDSAPRQGIISLNSIKNDPDYFLYNRLSSDSETLSLIRIDTLFCNTLSRQLTLLAGNGVMMYPFAPKPWQSFFYEQDFVEDKTQAKIYPFDFTTDNQAWSISSSIENLDTDEPRIIVLGKDIATFNQKFIVGRLLYPVVTRGQNESLLFAFDIILTMRFSFFSSTMANIVISLIILFVLVNLFIIRRVGKFGAQINKIIIQKFGQLKTGIRAISSGNLEYKLKMEGEDEFVELADHFNRMGDQLQQTIAKAREKDRLDHELQIARQVQISLLPGKLPNVKGYEIAATMKTANEVGGDFYDLISLGNNRFLFTVGDVSGKGSSAAFYMAQFISLLRFSPQFTSEPRELAQRLNEYFSTQLVDRQVFVTSIIGILDATKNQIQYVRAGHNFPILIPGDIKKDINEINTRGIGIGLTKSEKMFSQKLELKSLTLRPGDSFILFTDGIVEAARGTGGDSKAEVFGDTRFKLLLQDARHKSAKALMLHVNNELDKFYGQDPRVDDHTLIIINRLKKT